MHSNTGEAALAQQLVKLIRTESALNEDDDLVKLEAVQQVVKLTVLLRVTELDVVLLETMQSELGVVVHINFQRVSHELLANGSDLLREGSTEHHDLLVGGSGTEDLLDVATHVLLYVSMNVTQNQARCLPI